MNYLLINLFYFIKSYYEKQISIEYQDDFNKMEDSLQ
jgi:hypothetical protein